MVLKESQDPYGYKNLLVYEKAGELQRVCSLFTANFPRSKTLLALADQMERSARSVKQNIVEGWKRNSTKEYHQFLGFSLGANAELEEDCNDIIKGVYRDLTGIKGVMGSNSPPLTLGDIERLPFYPLDPRLPPVVQVKLRCKELNLLIMRLQSSLQKKMGETGGMGIKGAWGTGERGKAGETWLQKAIDEQGLERRPDGKLVPKGKKRD